MWHHDHDLNKIKINTSEDASEQIKDVLSYFLEEVVRGKRGR